MRHRLRVWQWEKSIQEGSGLRFGRGDYVVVPEQHEARKCFETIDAFVVEGLTNLFQGDKRPLVFADGGAVEADGGEEFLCLRALIRFYRDGVSSLGREAHVPTAHREEGNTQC